MNNNWRNTKTNNLFNAFLQLKTVDEMANFCRDLMTESEIAEFAGRWDVAQALDEGLPQRKVAEKTGISIATVTRVNKWLKNGMGGYRLVLDRLKNKSPKISHSHQSQR